MKKWAGNGKPAHVWRGVGTEWEDGVHFWPQSGRGPTAATNSFILFLSVWEKKEKKHWHVVGCVEELNTAEVGFGGARKIIVGELIQFWTVFSGLRLVVVV